MTDIRLCSIPECGNTVDTRGWCSKHYCRWKKYKDPLFTKTAPSGEPMRFFLETVLPYEGDECLAWPYGSNRHGYGRLYFNGRSRFVSRIVCEQLYGPAPSSSHEAAHSCGNGHLGCVSPKHLRWDTRRGNFADKTRHGTDNRGERHNLAKLTEEDVREIRRLARTTSGRAIAKRYGLSESHVSTILSRKSWAHI